MHLLAASIFGQLGRVHHIVVVDLVEPILDTDAYIANNVAQYKLPSYTSNLLDLELENFKSKALDSC